MAKLITTIENRSIKKELHFAGRIFTYTMKPVPGGKTADAACFGAVLEKEFGLDDDVSLDAAEKMDSPDESDIEEGLEILDALERSLASERERES